MSIGRMFDRSVLLGIGLVVALLVVSTGLTYRNTRQLNEDAGRVAHTHEVLNMTTAVLLTLLDAETGQRGFLITGKDTNAAVEVHDERAQGIFDTHAVFGRITGQLAQRRPVRGFRKRL